jgi:hypothetical protein
MSDVWQSQRLHAVLIADSGTDETIWLLAHLRREVVVGGTNRKFRARCVVQIGAESRPCTPPRLRPCGGMAARRSMDM